MTKPRPDGPSKHAQAILRSARIAELKTAVALVQPRPRVALPRDPKQRTTRLLALIAAERRRNAALVAQLK
jgi:hypothetical protein